MNEIEKAIKQALASPSLREAVRTVTPVLGAERRSLMVEIRAALANVAQAAAEAERERIVDLIRDVEDHGPDAMLASEIADRLEGGSL